VSTRLTESQKMALVEVADCVDLFAHPRTLHSLAARRLIVAEWPGLYRSDEASTCHVCVAGDDPYCPFCGSDE
jgi:hypothetical protein